MHYVVEDLTALQQKNSGAMFISTIYFKSGKPYWCSTDKPIADLSDLPWAPQEPNNLYVPERVMAFLHFESDFGIGDSNSITAWQYVCQYP